jgi:Zn finger protein HypA/HybF involved in hydrogenase expression
MEALKKSSLTHIEVELFGTCPHCGEEHVITMNKYCGKDYWELYCGCHVSTLYIDQGVRVIIELLEGEENEN